jgi:hypothetical protein
LRPAIGDAHDLIMITLLLVDLTPCVDDAASTPVSYGAPVMARRRWRDWRPHGSRGALVTLRRNDDRGASLTAPIVVVRAGLAHGRQRQHEEPDMKDCSHDEPRLS